MKNVLWNNIGKVHDVIFATPRLTAPLTQQKNLLHEQKWRIKKRLRQARTPMKINKIFLQNYLCFYNFVTNNMNNFDVTVNVKRKSFKISSIEYVY